VYVVLLHCPLLFALRLRTFASLSQHTIMSYVGRFAPSPTGPLHAGSLRAALASFLDARAHRGRWLVRIEDLDEQRTVAGAAENIVATLAAFGMHCDGDIVWQSQRKALYQAAFEQLGNHCYACSCSRKEIADSQTGLASDGAAIYPGTCRTGLAAGRAARAWRLRVPAAGSPDELVSFEDHWQGRVSEQLAVATGDFVLKRADGFWAYQLAVVVDDALQGVTDIVRGADLLGSTARQIYLQRLLGLTTPRYLHVPVVTNAAGEKLSKQTGAAALRMEQPVAALMTAATGLGLQLTPVASLQEFWEQAVPAWAQRIGQARPVRD
jgi:glutamyl-Q tRNA(Asp) synthetase